MSDTFTQKNLKAALALANAGFRIFPARPIFNTATGRWNKPPGIKDWQSLATDDPGQIRHWWEQFPNAIPAICCGDIVIIDADRHSDGPDGVAALANLANYYGEWPDHPQVMTPSNGEHHYFGQPGRRLGNRTGMLPPGIDVRGVGGFVIGPGALLPDGTEWHLPPGHSTDLPDLPKWLEKLIHGDEIHAVNTYGIDSPPALIRQEKYAEAVLEACVSEVQTVPKGIRNTTLNNVAYRLGRMIARGWIDRNKVENCLLYAACQLKNEDGLTAVMATIKSGINAGCKNPHPDLPDRKGGAQ